MGYLEWDTRSVEAWLEESMERDSCGCSRWIALRSRRWRPDGEVSTALAVHLLIRDTPAVINEVYRQLRGSQNHDALHHLLGHGWWTEVTHRVVGVRGPDEALRFWVLIEARQAAEVIAHAEQTVR